MTNIADLLRNAKKGTILWSPLFGPVEFMQLGKNDQIWIRVDNSEPFDKYGRYFGSRFTEAECLLFPSKDCRTWEGWKAPVEPNFKVGDWVVRKDGTTFCSGNYAEQITLIEVDGEGKCIWLSSTSWVCDDAIRLWTIQDAKDGDVLAAHECYAIFKEIDRLNIKCYCAYHYMGFNPTLYKNTLQNKTAFKPATKEQRDLLFNRIKENGYTWDADKKKLRKIINPKFKVGDWITNDTWTHCIQSISDGFYHFLEGGCLDFGKIDGYYRLWEISDARNGDVLVLNGFSKEYKWIGIFKELTSDTSFSSHCHYNCGMCEFVTDIARCTKHGIKYNDMRPATNEERDILFAKMREAGYTWDENKKELKKLKHYDISSFHAGMPVLVRADNVCRWNYSVFSHITGNKDWQFAVCNGVSFSQCIPFEGNETLLGTNDMCNERFVNW